MDRRSHYEPLRLLQFSLDLSSHKCYEKITDNSGWCSQESEQYKKSYYLSTHITAVAACDFSTKS